MPKKNLVLKAHGTSDKPPGVPSAPPRFILSTEKPDISGDIVKQDWDLSAFESNPIALYQHDHDIPIGTWTDIRSEGRLSATLRLAEPGTSETIDSITKLIRQGVLRAVSVGFVPGQVDETEDGAWIMSRNTLFEASIVSVPANSEALKVELALSAVAFSRGREIAIKAARSAKAQMESRDSESQLSVRHRSMNINDSIVNLQEQINESGAELTQLSARLSGGESLSDDEHARVKSLSGQIIDQKKQLESYLAIEKSAAIEARPVAAPRLQSVKPLDPKKRMGAMLQCMYRGYVERRSPIDVAKSEYPGHQEVALVTKAAVDPARTDVAGWAAELVQETWGTLLAAIYDETVYGRTPGDRLTFGMSGKINRPRNDGRGQLAGDFIAEGAPIPVKQGLYANVDLTPKRLKSITTATSELLNRSNPNAGVDMANQLTSDTAEILDTRFLDSGARTTTRPAGLQDPTETGAGNINASAGAEVRNVITDITGVIDRLNAVNLGATGAWVMSRTRALSLSYKQDAASGEFVFRDELAGGTFAGFPVLISNNVPNDVVYMIAGGAMSYASEMGPEIATSTETALHMEDTDPKDIVYDDTGATPALPTKSMFQTSSVAFRLEWGMDWRIVRPAGVQVLTGVAW